MYNGTWSVEVGSCSIDISAHLDVSSDDPALYEAVKRIDPAIVAALVDKYQMDNANTTVGRRQFLGRTIQDVDPRNDPSSVIAMVYGVFFMLSLSVLAWITMRKWGQYLSARQRIEVDDTAGVPVYEVKTKTEGV